MPVATAASRSTSVGSTASRGATIATSARPGAAIASASAPKPAIATFIGTPTIIRGGVGPTSITIARPESDTADNAAFVQAYIFAAASSGYRLIIPYHFHIGTVGLTIPSGFRCLFQDEGKLTLLPHTATSYEILRIHDVGNIEIENASIDGNRDANSATTGEHGHGVSIRGATDTVSLPGLRTVNCWGDGLYIGASRTGGLGYSADVYTSDHVSDNNRRQGVSIVSVRTCVMDDPEWTNTNGTNPQAGLDIEPNSITDRLDSITINRPVTGDNTGNGIVINLDKFEGAEREVNILITDHEDDGSRGGFGVGGVDFGPNVTGTIRTTNPIWRNNGFAGFGADRWPDQNVAVEVVSPQVIDSNRLGHASARFNSPYSIYRPSDDSTGGEYDIGNITISNPSLVMISNTVSRIFYIRDETGNGSVSNVTIEDPVTLDIGDSAATAIRSRIEGDVTTSDANEVWQEERDSTATITTQTYVHRILCTNSSTATFTLGTDFDDGTPVPQFEVAGTGEVMVAPPSGAAFVGQATDAYYKSTTSGSTLTIVSHGGSSFEVTAQTGTWTVV